MVHQCINGIDGAKAALEKSSPKKGAPRTEAEEDPREDRAPRVSLVAWRVCMYGMLSFCVFLRIIANYCVSAQYHAMDCEAEWMSEDI